MSLGARILERYRRYGWTLPPGEWEDINGNIRVEYHALLEAGNAEDLEGMLAMMFGTRAVWGLVTFDFNELPEKRDEFVTAMGENASVWMASTDATTADLERIRAPMVGRPLVAHMEGVPIMFDTPRHDHYAHKIARLLPHGGTVLEIGGGYGGMARQILQARDDIRVVIVDLPEALYLAWYWLSEQGVRVGWWDENPSADVVLVPAHEKEAVKSGDMVFAAHSLSEFTLPVVRDYMAWLERLAPRYFYHDNAHLESKGVAAPEVLASDMVPKGYREVYRAPTIWPMMGGRYWEFLMQRGEE